MKKVYIPTEEEIQKLKYLGVNTHSYILSKVVEALIIEDIVYEEINMLDIAYKYLSEFPEIIYAICRIYPEKIASSKLAARDIDLCRLITSKISRQDASIYQLDSLSYFNQESDVVSDSIVIKNIIKNLAEYLPSTPRYRFDYKEPNILLDNIFACEIPMEKIATDTYDDLVSIDPIYITKLGLNLEQEKDRYVKNKAFGLQRGMARYINRYNMNEINRNNQQEKTKKLIRCLEYHRQNYM